MLQKWALCSGGLCACTPLHEVFPQCPFSNSFCPVAPFQHGVSQIPGLSPAWWGPGRPKGCAPKAGAGRGELPSSSLLAASPCAWQGCAQGGCHSQCSAPSTAWPHHQLHPHSLQGTGGVRAPGGHGWHSEMSRILVAIQDWENDRPAHSSVLDNEISSRGTQQGAHYLCVQMFLDGVLAHPVPGHPTGSPGWAESSTRKAVAGWYHKSPLLLWMHGRMLCQV